MAIEKGHDPARVLDMARHADRQALHTLEDVEGVGGAHARPEIPQALGPRARDEGRRPELLGEIDAVIAEIGLGQRRELARGLPVEGAGIDDDTADGDPVSPQKLRRRVHDDVAAVLEGAEEAGRGEGAVDHERYALLMGDGGDRRHVHDLQAGVAQGLAEHEAGLRPDRLAEPFGVAGMDEARLDSEARQGMGEEVVAAAVDRGGRDDVTARIHQGRHREMKCRLPARRADRADAPFQRRDPLLQHRGPSGSRSACRCGRRAPG